MLITRVPCVFDMTFSLYLQPRINIIESKLESSTSERNAEYKSQVELLPCSTARLAGLHGNSTTWFQTSRYCRAKVELNSSN